MPYVFRNNLRRIISSKQTIFNTSRLAQYFRNDSALEVPYIQAVRYVAAARCDQVGLFMNANYWDYPFWVIFEKKGYKVRLEHMRLSRIAPKAYPLGPFNPCAVIALNISDEELVIEGYPVFKKAQEFPSESSFVRNVTVYIKPQMP